MGVLSKDQIERLETLKGWVWDSIEDYFEKGFSVNSGEYSGKATKEVIKLINKNFKILIIISTYYDCLIISLYFQKLFLGILSSELKSIPTRPNFLQYPSAHSKLSINDQCMYPSRATP